jgi:protein-tyrosine phosphatase
MEESKASPLRERILGRLKVQGRRLLETLERRRTEALRRNPARLTRRLRGARSILILCAGNVTRSVFAAHLLSAAVDGRRAISIRSAGLETVPGWRAHPRVIARCQDLNMDLRGHASAAVTGAMLAAADVVMVMEVSQAVVVVRRFPRARWKTFLLACLAPDVPIDIADPAGKDDATVDACLDHIAQALKPVIEILTDHDGPAASR